MPEITTDPRRAAAVIAAGGLVAIPTETVYGLAADAESEAAVRRIFAVKGRPSDHPLIVHLAAAEQVHDGWADPFPESARVLAETCWPGPLTLLVPAGPRVGSWVTGGRPSVGLRVPAHAMTIAMLEAFGGGVAAPSANRFGRVSPTSAAHVIADLGDDVDLVLDGGECPVGVESTIVDCTVEPVQVLRPGAITPEQVTALLGAVAPASGPSRSAGMLASHYSPSCAVELFDDRASARSRFEQLETSGSRAVWLDAATDVVGAAQSLYGVLRAADQSGADVVVALLPPLSGLGYAVRDRLTKAAAPRP
jgi:L-threonylcarbamoyladenylate synthase